MVLVRETGYDINCIAEHTPMFHLAQTFKIFVSEKRQPSDFSLERGLCLHECHVLKRCVQEQMAQLRSKSRHFLSVSALSPHEDTKSAFSGLFQISHFKSSILILYSFLMK